LDKPTPSIILNSDRIILNKAQQFHQNALIEQSFKLCTAEPEDLP